jgi:hypothetical protein
MVSTVSVVDLLITVELSEVCAELPVADASVLVLVLVLHGCAVTVSSTGAENQFQGDDNRLSWRTL